MKKLFISALIAFTCMSTYASDFFNDKWSGPDKTKHLIVGLATGSVSTFVTKDEWKGAAVGCAVGAVKEVYDARSGTKHVASFQDFAVTCLGSALGAGITKFVLYKEQGKTMILYKMEL